MGVAAIMMIPLTYILCSINNSWTSVVLACCVSILPYELIQPFQTIHYLKKKDVKKIALAIAERFPGSRLLFDTVGKLGYRLMMKAVLKTHKMKDFGDLFHTEDAVKDFSGWSDRIRVTARGYMLGYFDMKAPGVRSIHRLLAKVGDNVMKMQIVRMDM